MSSRTTGTDIPGYDADLFSDDAILNPFDHYRRLRDLGSVVRLSDPSICAVARYEDVRSVLADHDNFVSGEGVALNDFLNSMLKGTTLTSDPPLHDELRRLVAHRLTPKALRTQADAVAEAADELVDGLLERAGDIDVVSEIGRAMPLKFVPDFVGFPEECRARLFRWSAAGADNFGPAGARTAVTAPVAGEMAAYAEGMVALRRAVPGSLARDLYQAADRGEVSQDRCAALLLDYLGPALETTAGALSSAMALFAARPDQWDHVRADRDLIPGAVNEVVRLETPLRGFARVAACDVRVGDQLVPAGTRIWVLFASANRDEREWVRPDEFDVTRNNAHHVGFGYGLHGCAGQGLARMEISAVLRALATKVARIEATGTPRHVVNNIIRAHEKLTVRLRAA